MCQSEICTLYIRRPLGRGTTPQFRSDDRAHAAGRQQNCQRLAGKTGTRREACGGEDFAGREEGGVENQNLVHLLRFDCHLGRAMGSALSFCVIPVPLVKYGRRTSKLSSGSDSRERPEELSIYAERHFHFMNLWTVYHDLLKGDYVPSLNDDEYPVGITMMLVLYSYFYSLVEDSDEGLNGFRIWRQKLPQEEAAITTVEARVRPFLVHLRLFRNRMGFHGSRTRAHESEAFELFNKHSGTEIYQTMKQYKALAAALFGMDMALHSGDADKIAQWRARLDVIGAS